MSPDRPGIVVQARMGSTRLPGKVLMRIRQETMLGHLLLRLKRCRTVAEIVVATTVDDRDDAIAAEARERGALVFRGSENDVLSRYVGAAREHGLDPVIRITSDCPLADPSIVDEAVDRFLARRAAAGGVDGVTNARPGARTYPRGLDVEVVARRALEDADARLGRDAPEREHVTQYLYRNPERYRIEDLRLPLDLSFLRWTVDTEDDLSLVREIYGELFASDPGFGLRDVLALLGRRPELLLVNAHVRQKGT